jgi:D5 N terminal like
MALDTATPVRTLHHAPDRAGRLGTPSAKPQPTQRRIRGTCFDLMEDGIALAFTAQHQAALRYCHHTGAWFQWNGSIWRREETKIAFNWARQVCREIAIDAGKAKATLSRASTAAAVERFAQADRAFAVTSEIWAERCILDPNLQEKPGRLVSACRTWTAENGEPPDPCAVPQRDRADQGRLVRDRQGDAACQRCRSSGRARPPASEGK